MLGTNIQDSRKREWLEKMLKSTSRTVLTSGSLEPVLDSGSDGHSIFSRAFITTLKQNSEILPGHVLFNRVSKQVKQAAERFRFEQTPQYAPIRHTDHKGSDFFFAPIQAHNTSFREMNTKMR